jgi:hypothetical protein
MYFAGAYGGTPTIKAVNSSNVSTDIATLPTSSGSLTAFVCKFNSTGTYQYSRLLESTGSDVVYSVMCDSTDNMYISGGYGGTPTIKAVNSSNVSTDISTLPISSGTSAAYLIKFDPDGNYAP